MICEFLIRKSPYFGFEVAAGLSQVVLVCSHRHYQAGLEKSTPNDHHLHHLWISTELDSSSLTIRIFHKSEETPREVLRDESEVTHPGEELH